MEVVVALIVLLLAQLLLWKLLFQPQARKLRFQKVLLQLQKARVEELEQDLRWSRSKVQAQQLDLDRWAEKNRLWAQGKVDQIMQQSRQGQAQQEWPRAQGWKKYQMAQEQESELNQESDRQQAERNRWVQE